MVTHLLASGGHFTFTEIMTRVMDSMIEMIRVVSVIEVSVIDKMMDALSKVGASIRYR